MGRPGVSGPGAVGVGGPQGPISRGGKAGARVRLFFVPHYKGARCEAGAFDLMTVGRVRAEKAANKYYPLDTRDGADLFDILPGPSSVSI